MSSFELSAGNGRMYPLTEDEKKAVIEGNKKRAKEHNQDWLATKASHDFSGFIKLDQKVINFMQAGLNHSSETGEECRMRFHGYRAKKQDGSPQLNLESAFIKGVGALKKFEESATQQPKKQATKEVSPFDDDVDAFFA